MSKIKMIEFDVLYYFSSCIRDSRQIKVTWIKITKYLQESINNYLSQIKLHTTTNEEPYRDNNNILIFIMTQINGGNLDTNVTQVGFLFVD